MSKICFFSGDITRNGGTERMAVLIANELYNRGYDVMVVSLAEQHKKMTYTLNQNIKHIAISKKWIFFQPKYLTVLPKLRHIIKREGIDLLIDVDVVLDVLSVLSSVRLNVKVISWEHFNYRYEMSVPYRRRIIKMFSKKTDAFVTLTRKDAKSYQKFFTGQHNVTCIHNPLFRLESGGLLVIQEKYIVTIGRLSYQKGLDDLMTVAEAVLKAHEDWKWYILGEGEQYGQIQKMIAERHLEGKLILKGWVSDVGSFLKKASLFVMTSRYEGLPLSILEAKAYQVPCVSFCSSKGLEEVIIDGENGYLVPPRDCNEMIRKMECLMQDDELRRKFSENAWNGMEAFDLDFIMKQWQQLLEGMDIGRKHESTKRI